VDPRNVVVLMMLGSLILIGFTHPVLNKSWTPEFRNEWESNNNEIANLTGWSPEKIGRLNLQTHPTQRTLSNLTPEAAPVLAIARSGPILPPLSPNQEEADKGSPTPPSWIRYHDREVLRLPNSPGVDSYIS
jgi:hypothetical protein